MKEKYFWVIRVAVGRLCRGRLFSDKLEFELSLTPYFLPVFRFPHTHTHTHTHTYIYIYMYTLDHTYTIILLQMALRPGVGLGLLYNMPPGLSVPCSVSPFVYTHLSQVHGHVIHPSHSWSSALSRCVQLSVHLFWDFGVLHSFYVAKPSYYLAFNKPDNALSFDYGF